ncbi:unnamed protein product [Nezara viridula]|uniref:Protein transport protein Sec24C n=1 Tax=Nezara viridula TaxID=85310 RepID=A0A9P0MR31_NEZVI|nr:unnamed protein product [Nezara viridula]
MVVQCHLNNTVVQCLNMVVQCLLNNMVVHCLLNNRIVQCLCPLIIRVVQCHIYNRVVPCHLNRVVLCHLNNIAVQCHLHNRVAQCPLNNKVVQCHLNSRLVPCLLNNRVDQCHLKNRVDQCHLNNRVDQCHLYNRAVQCHLNNRAVLCHLNNRAVPCHLNHRAVPCHLNNRAVPCHLNNRAVPCHLNTMHGGPMPPQQHGGSMSNNFQPPSSNIPLGYNSAPSHPGALPARGAPPMPLPVSSPGPGGPQHPSMYPPGSQQMGRPPMPQLNQLAGQMSTMNINGQPMPPMSQQHPGEYPGGGLQGPPSMGYAPPGQLSRYPAVNGGPPSQTMNGLPDTSGPGRPPQSRYPPMPESGGGQTTAYLPSPQQGYPPQPGFPSQPQPGYPGGIGQQQYAQQQRRLDPDQMPSPMQVMEDDQKTRSGVFYTHQKGQVPPLVTTEFIVQDQGNTSPRFMRSTMYNVPINSDMMKQASVPFGLVLSPMAEVADKEHPPPLVSFGEVGPVRCIRCKAYMCPNMQFIDGGRRFHCLLCKATTDVPAEYFQHLDHTGQRVDRFERAELVLGTYDIIATAEYCKDSQYPNPPALIFVIDVSYNNVKSGLVSLLCRQMKNILCNLPKERGQEKSPMKVGFITYNSAVHFYNIRPNLGQPQMLVVGDTQEMFMPLLDGFLVDPEESEGLIDALMTNIPMMFADTRETETILAPAIQAGLEALKASGCAGKLLVFHSSLPIAEAPGKLKNRDDRSLLGTDKEKTILLPQNQVYNTLGQDCVGAGVSVDLFITNNSYIDLATIGQVSRLTGGEIYKYTYFQAELDGERLITDVEKNIRRLCAFDAIMRVRTSTGIRPTDFYGHFYMSNTTDIELASIDPDKGIAVEIKHDDKLSEEEGVYIQVALLYTSLSGQRRIRVLNLVLKACSQMSELYRTCELDTVINFFAKQSVFKLLDASAKAVKESLINRSAQILACYRKNCASPTSAGQLILPECMKLLPLYINCLLKSDAISGGKDMTVDDKWFVMAAVLTMDVPSSLAYFYPRLYSLLDVEDNLPPPCIRCSSEKMADNGVYLLVNGIYMFLWLGLATPSDWVMSVFGVPSAAQVDIDRHRLPVLENPISERVRNTISSVADSNHRTMRLTIVRQRDKMEMVMKHFLVEDRGLDGSSSYVDFLCHLHKEIRNLLS